MGQLKAVVLSSSKIKLSWEFTGGTPTQSDMPVSQTLYRDGEELPVEFSGQASYIDSGLAPNRRYGYQMVFGLDDGTVAAEASAVTLAHRPIMVGPLNVTEDGFTVVIVDDVNPPGQCIEPSPSIFHWTHPRSGALRGA